MPDYPALKIVGRRVLNANFQAEGGQPPSLRTDRLVSVTDPDSLFYVSPDDPSDSMRTPGEEIWRVGKGNQWWSCELRDYRKFGFKAEILRNGVLTAVGRLLPTRAVAVQWAESQLARFHETGPRATPILPSGQKSLTSASRSAFCERWEPSARRAALRSAGGTRRDFLLETLWSSPSRSSLR